MGPLVLVAILAGVFSSGVSGIACPPNNNPVACLVNPCRFKVCPYGLTCVNDACAPCTAFCVKEGQCVVDGSVYNLGQSFPAPDGCNTCSCGPNGLPGCTKIGCQTRTCKYNGQTYNVGDKFKAIDGCNTCVCGADGSVSCTEKTCQCHVDGKVYNPGESFPAGDGCNVCTCQESGIPICTLIACPTCQYNGQTYKPGDSFPSTDGCNQCSCNMDGSVACTEKACACPLYKCKPCTTGHVVDANGCQTCKCLNPECEGVTCNKDEYCTGGRCCPESDKYVRCSDPCEKQDCGLFRVCKRVCACNFECVFKIW